MDAESVTIVLRDGSGEEWRVTETSPTGTGRHHLTVAGPDVYVIEIEADSRTQVRALLREALKSRPDILALLT